MVQQSGADNLPYEKVGKNEPVCIADEVPFEIPKSWEWVRIGTIFTLQAGKNIKASDIFESNFDGSYLCYGGNGVRGYVKSYNREGTYPIIGRQGALCGNIKYAKGKFYATEHAVCVETFAETNVKWACAFLEALNLNQYATATAQPGLAVANINTVLIPLPPKNEQQHIVNVLISLQPFIKTYAKKESELHFLNQQFSDLLKKSILQEAIRGKLVPQDPADEPASVLLEHIRAEKKRLIQEEKIKRNKHESVIYRRDNSHYEKHGSEEVCIDEKLPFEIPDNWEWVKLSDLAQFIGGYAYKSETFIEKSEYQVLRLGNVKNDEIRYSAKPVFISKELAEKTVDFRCKPNDILFTMTGTRLKRDYFYTVAVSNKDTNCFINQRVGCLREYYPNIYKWLIWVLKSEGILSQVFKYETGTANQGNLGAENIMKTFIPLPPLNEQNRICNMIECLLKKTSAL